MSKEPKHREEKQDEDVKQNEAATPAEAPPSDVPAGRDPQDLGIPDGLTEAQKERLRASRDDGSAREVSIEDTARKQEEAFAQGQKNAEAALKGEDAPGTAEKYREAGLEYPEDAGAAKDKPPVVPPKKSDAEKEGGDEQHSKRK